MRNYFVRRPTRKVITCYCLKYKIITYHLISLQKAKSNNIIIISILTTVSFVFATWAICDIIAAQCLRYTLAVCRTVEWNHVITTSVTWLLPCHTRIYEKKRNKRLCRNKLNKMILIYFMTTKLKLGLNNTFYSALIVQSNARFFCVKQLVVLIF